MSSVASSLSISSKYDIDNMDDISSFSKLKKVRNVKYSKLLEDKMISRETKNKALQQKQKVVFEQVVATRMIGSRMIKHIKRKLYDKSFTCNRTLLNIKEPEKLLDWYSHNGYRAFCVFCDRPAVHNIVGCKFCTSVIHLSCLVKEIEEIQRLSNHPDMEDDTLVTSSVIDLIESNGVEINISIDGDSSIINNNNNDDDSIDDQSNNEDNNEDNINDNSNTIDDNNDNNDTLFTENSISTTNNDNYNSSTIVSNSNKIEAANSLDDTNSNNDHYEPYTSAFSSTDDALGYVCFLCRDGYAEDKAFYEKVLDKLKAEDKSKKANNFICKKLFSHVEFIRYRKQKAGITLVQSMLRRRKARHDFRVWQRAQMRVVILEFDHIHEQLLKQHGQGLMTITVVDPITHQQIFRFDRTPDQVNNEAILVPGMTAYMVIVVTYSRLKDASTKTYSFKRQGSLYLRDVEYFYERRAFDLTFAKKVQWVPEVVKDETVVNILLPGQVHHSRSDSNNNNSRLDTRDGRRSPKEHDTTTNEFNADLDGFGSLNLYDDDDNNTDSICLVYNPLNIVGSIAQLVIAPPVDLLRKPADVFVANPRTSAANSQQGRTTQWWICLANLKLYFYQFFGDTKARYVSDLSHAAVYAGKELTNNFLATIVHADKRTWTLEFSSPFYAQKFEFAVMEMRKIVDDKNSKYFRSIPKFKPINWKS